MSEATPIYNGLDIRHTIGGLTPYIVYEFQLQVENQAGYADYPMWVSSQTLSAGNLLNYFSHYIHLIV